MSRPIRHPLIIAAHPDVGSYTFANVAAAQRGFDRAGVPADLIDLYRDGFHAAMTRAERAAYFGDAPIIDPLVGEYAERVLAADSLVFVYPTWWSTLPAILKGFLDRTMVPGVAFKVTPSANRPQPGLGNIRRIVGVSTYGSSRRYVRFVNDNGRRTINRIVRLSAGLSTRTTWLGLYRIDHSTADQRSAFTAKVEAEVARLAGGSPEHTGGRGEPVGPSRGRPDPTGDDVDRGDEADGRSPR